MMTRKTSPINALLKAILLGVGVVVAGALLIQLLPFGQHTNPPVVAEPAWDSSTTRATFMKACGDCHSNETVWPWYSHIAPVSWLITHDVEEGRSKLNVSEWGMGRNEAGEAAEKVQNGQMPDPKYVLLHPDTKLSAAEKSTFIQGLIATFGGENEGGEAGDDD